MDEDLKARLIEAGWKPPKEFQRSQMPGLDQIIKSNVERSTRRSGRDIVVDTQFELVTQNIFRGTRYIQVLVYKLIGKSRSQRDKNWRDRHAMKKTSI